MKQIYGTNRHSYVITSERMSLRETHECRFEFCRPHKMTNENFINKWIYFITHTKFKYLACSHEMAITDNQGYEMECKKCGIPWSQYETWGEKFNPLGGYFNLTERTIGFLTYKFIIREKDMPLKRLEIS